MPMVIEITFELEFTRIAAVKVHCFYYNIISTSKRRHRAILLLYLCVQYNVLQKYSFDRTSPFRLT